MHDEQGIIQEQWASMPKADKSRQVSLSPRKTLMCVCCEEIHLIDYVLRQNHIF